MTIFHNHITAVYYSSVYHIDSYKQMSEKEPIQWSKNYRNRWKHGFRLINLVLTNHLLSF